MMEKYSADHREIFWPILIREKYGSPAIPTQGGFFLIRPSHPMKQSSDPITIIDDDDDHYLIMIIMMKKNKRQSMDLITILIAKSLRLPHTSLPRISL